MGPTSPGLRSNASGKSEALTKPHQTSEVWSDSPRGHEPPQTRLGRGVAPQSPLRSPDCSARSFEAPPCMTTPSDLDPVLSPHEDEKRRVTTETDPEPKHQVRCRFRSPSLVTEAARFTLSRWRHGFKSRWDYFQGLIRTRREKRGAKTSGNSPLGRSSGPSRRRPRAPPD
jgi:hypothetical protein